VKSTIRLKLDIALRVEIGTTIKIFFLNQSQLSGKQPQPLQEQSLHCRQGQGIVPETRFNILKEGIVTKSVP